MALHGPLLCDMLRPYHVNGGESKIEYRPFFISFDEQLIGRESKVVWYPIPRDVRSLIRLVQESRLKRVLSAKYRRIKPTRF